MDTEKAELARQWLVRQDRKAWQLLPRITPCSGHRRAEAQQGRTGLGSVASRAWNSAWWSRVMGMYSADSL